MDFNFKLTEQESNLVFNILAKEPYNVVASVIAKMQTQANEQVNNKELKSE